MTMTMTIAMADDYDDGYRDDAQTKLRELWR